MDDITKSLMMVDKIQEGALDTVKSIGVPAAKALGNFLIAATAGLSAYEVYERFKRGDYAGAAIKFGASAATIGAAVALPVIGGLITSVVVDKIGELGLDALDEKYLQEFIYTLPHDADIDVAMVQLALVDLGENITVDGKITPEFKKLLAKHQDELAQQ